MSISLNVLKASLIVPFLSVASGCVTSSTQPTTEAAAPQPDQVEQVTYEITEDAPQLEKQEWQSSLSEDLDSVEKLGQVFLESSFSLYDRLLKEDISEKDTDSARTAVFECRAKYNDLVVAIERLKGNLSRAEVQEALPLDVEGNKEELDAVMQSLALYVPAEFNREDYQVGEGKYLTSMMFPKLPEDLPEYMGSLPKANRDALLLLDHLQRISGDLSNLSSTLTAWIYDSASFDAESFVH